MYEHMCVHVNMGEEERLCGGNMSPCSVSLVFGAALLVLGKNGPAWVNETYLSSLGLLNSPTPWTSPQSKGSS